MQKYSTYQSSEDNLDTAWRLLKDLSCVVTTLDHLLAETNQKHKLSKD